MSKEKKSLNPKVLAQLKREVTVVVAQDAVSVLRLRAKAYLRVSTTPSN